ncbi:MAG TPA: nitroreductase, partial [Phycisphaerae bacterium]|nr:nitroreductase [Phycisphaerae bacterium]
MDLYEAINARRSVRAYWESAVEEDKLLRVLDAGRLAPSGNNRQAWQFVVVRDVDAIKEIAEDVAEQPWMANAPVIIAVVGLDPERDMLC